MILTFDRQHVQRLLDAAETSTKTYPSLYEEMNNIPPEAALWLVADKGIYLMSNGNKPEQDPKGYAHVAFAKECNPHTTADWDDVKRHSFGDDDGVEVLGARALRAWLKRLPDHKPLELDISPENIKLVTHAKG